MNSADIFSRESEILYEYGEYLAGGIFEEPEAPMTSRFARGFTRHFENCGLPAYESGRLYPSGKSFIYRKDKAVEYNYSYSLSYSADKFAEYLAREEGRPGKALLTSIDGDLKTFTANPLSRSFHVGGAGYTHSIINYERILREGMLGYRENIKKVALSGNKEFYNAILETLNALILWHSRCLEYLGELKNKNTSKEFGMLAEAFASVPLRPASNFYEAVLAVNVMWYLDGCDSIGNLDKYLLPFYEKESIDDAEAVLLLREFFRNVDANGGWHMILGGKLKERSGYSRLTVLCLEALRGIRRPNTGMKINKEMPLEIWNAIFDSLESANGNPSLYNEDLYLEWAPLITDVRDDDKYKLAYGGCTELMFEGMSNVGSIDAGINMLSVFERVLRTKLGVSSGFDEFFDFFKAELKQAIKRVVEEVNLNQDYKALYRPQMIRSLFTDGCIESGREYNRGGAVYNGAVINFAALANAVNSLYTVSKFFSGDIPLSSAEFIKMLDADFEGYENIHRRILNFDKYGNNSGCLNELAFRTADFVFSETLKYKCSRGNGFFIPSCIMFVTYIQQGKKIGATPDGRNAFSAVADSIGPMQGTDTEGPTSMLNSVASLPQAKGLGTLVLNLRLDRKVLSNPEQRKKVRHLIESYFNMGGMQIQVNTVDSETLKKAKKNPDAYKNLTVRIGGYTDYFKNLDEELQDEIIKRTEHVL